MGKMKVTYCARCRSGIAIDPIGLPNLKWVKKTYKKRECWLCPDCARDVNLRIPKNSVRTS